MTKIFLNKSKIIFRFKYVRRTIGILNPTQTITDLFGWSHKRDFLRCAIRLYLIKKDCQQIYKKS